MLDKRLYVQEIDTAENSNSSNVRENCVINGQGQ